MTQQAEVDGEHNTVVQISGSGNQVQLGGRRLSLTLPGDVARPGAQSDTLSMFYPGSRSTTFIGRERERKMLDAFLDAEAPLSFLVLTGDGGSGKTRLALELCLARRELGWEAGFISSRELDDADAGTGRHGDRDTLIVVDYAASRAQQLRDVLRALSNQPDSGRRLRFLLLERTAKDDAGWLSTLLGDGGERSHAVRRLQYGNSPHALSPLTGRETLLALARDFLTALGRPDDAWQRDEDLVRRLLDAAWGGNPLYLMLAAYTMLYRDDRSTTWTREKLAEEFAGKEMERIRGQASARGLDGDFLVELAACVTLAQGVTKEEFDVWAKKIHAAEGMSDRWRSYVDALPEVLPHQPEGEEDRHPPCGPTSSVKPLCCAPSNTERICSLTARRHSARPRSTPCCGWAMISAMPTRNPDSGSRPCWKRATRRKVWPICTHGCPPPAFPCVILP
ncbi:ATP-binding protein [uncultured Desulfovibrio sp.]|uniref:ATP-binding protein n=1 Tax=uncultured Desulfovibrio sp. TaxID=167968 RepID=UPI0026252E01|nr:ATP-binding protein [uncultured Desulfovibrio sp.]